MAASRLRTSVRMAVHVVLICAALYALWRWVDWARVWGALRSR